MRTSSKGALKRRVDEVLFYVWDPIGVSDEPFARGEYESFVPAIVALVERTDDVQLIADHLAGIIQKNMELSADGAKCDYAAKMMLQHKKAIREGCA